MTEEEEYKLAERLARAMGAELLGKTTVFGSLIIRLVSKGADFSDFRSCFGEWHRRKYVLRGIGHRKGLLDLGTSWPGLDLPKGLSKDSTDEEIDLRLTAMGF